MGYNTRKDLGITKRQLAAKIIEYLKDRPEIALAQMLPLISLPGEFKLVAVDHESRVYQIEITQCSGDIDAKGS